MPQSRPGAYSLELTRDEMIAIVGWSEDKLAKYRDYPRTLYTSKKLDQAGTIQRLLLERIDTIRIHLNQQSM